MAKRKSRSKPARRAAGDAPAQLLETLHRIWLAGLGAAARAQRGAPQLMQELVEEGAHIHTETRGAAEKALRGLLGNTKAAVNLRVSQAKGQATDALESLEKIFQTRVHRALTQLGVPSAEEVASLSSRVTELNASINKLARARKPARPRMGASRRAANAEAMSGAP